MKQIFILMFLPLVRGKLVVFDSGESDSAFDVPATTDDAIMKTLSGEMVGETECEKNGFYNSEFGSSFDESNDVFYRLRYGLMSSEETTAYSEIKTKIDEFAASHCKTAESNPKLTYTSKDVCTFKFHSITVQEKIPDAYLSSSCNDKNVVESVKSYMIDDPPQESIDSWPDVCVGDFLRCYDVKRDRPILLRHICTAETILKKDFPEGTTHVSVDCREDKQKQVKYMQETFAKVQVHGSNDMDEYAQQRNKEKREMYFFMFSLIGIFVLGTGTCMVAIHRYAFVPYLQAMKKTKGVVDDSMNGDSELVPIRTRLTTESRQPLI